MTAQTPEELIEISSDLLRSLHDSLRRARRISEDYLAQFEAEQDINLDTAQLKPQIAKLDGLIRDIQKVEKTLVDRKDAPGAARMVAFDPRVCVTTTPRNVPLLKQLLESPSTVTTHAPTEANRANLAPSFLAEVRAL